MHKQHKKKTKIFTAVRSAAGLPALVMVLAVGLSAGGFSLASNRNPRQPNTGGGTAGSRPAGSSVPPATATPAPLTVTAITPKNGARAVRFGTDVTILFSAPVAPSRVVPKLKPAPPGHWVWATPEKLVFRPEGFFEPFSHVKVIVPGGPGGLRTNQGMTLHRSVKSSFAVKDGSTLRLQQLLADLGYLPVRFSPTTSSASSGGAAVKARPTVGPGTEPGKMSAIPVAPLPGKFTWRYRRIPSSLSALWSPGSYDTVTRGAVMQFELSMGLPTDGQAGPEVWAGLLRAVAHRDINRAGYNYVYVTTGAPEFVYLWHNGAVIFKTPANTGIPQAPTAIGTWPVYARYVTTTMSGTNPNGSHYSDPGIPWVSYFNGGDALHGFLRASYGYPQSLGCVEMPYPAAKTLFPFTPIGTLVTVL